MKLALLNTSIITADGEYSLETITTEEAIDLIAKNKNNLLSAIGHDAVAQIMSTVLNVDIKVNRLTFVQEIGQVALVFKTRSRVPEGVVLSRKETEEIGYDFKLLTRIV